MKTTYQLNFMLKRVLTIALFAFYFISCDDFVKIDAPRTDLIKATVFEDDATATAAVLDIYYQMSFQGFASGNQTSFTYLAAIASDEAINYLVSDAKTTLEVKQFGENIVTPNNAYLLRLWSDNYKYIYKANAIIEGLSQSLKITENVKQQLIGEAKFIRAFSYFYLVNIWGSVPLVTTTDYRVNGSMPKAPAVDIYNQIIEDLKEAQLLLASDYSKFNNERVRVNSGAATAMLARVYLYVGDYVNAEIQSTALITNTSLYSLATNLINVFDKNNKEVILQFWSMGRPNERTSFRFLSTPIFGALRPDLVNGFEVNDQRKSTWVSIVQGRYSCQKYYSTAISPPSQYSTVLRLAEQYLIRSEARTKLSNFSGAQADLNVIRQRAGLSNTTANDNGSLLLAIEQERRSELFTEWGHRWLDLKRFGRSDAVLGPLKQQWKSTAVLLPIPESEIINNPALTQNDGY